MREKTIQFQMINTYRQIAFFAVNRNHHNDKGTVCVTGTPDTSISMNI